jgi:hypothetical protein
VVALLSVVLALLTLSYTPGSMFLTFSAVLFVWDAVGRGESVAGDFDLRLLWRGWKRAILVGMVLAAMTLQMPWENWEYYAPGYTSRENIGSGRVRQTYHSPFHAQGTQDAYSLGKATVPVLLILGTLAWATWRGEEPVRRRGTAAAGVVATDTAAIGDAEQPAPPGWFRYVPAALAGAFVVYAVINLQPGSSPFGGAATWAAGPTWMLIGLLPYYVGAAMIARKGYNTAVQSTSTAAPAAA